jgi:hypothetical protein
VQRMAMNGSFSGLIVLVDDKDTLEGKGFVFPSLEALLTHFALFCDLMAFESVISPKFRGEFQGTEGISLRDLSFFQPLRTSIADHVEVV